ncbi:MAG: dTMP kinase [Alphaproteobacteria bacterium]
MKTKAKFITFEGGEGAGKTTQIQILEKLLKSHGLPVITTREPGGTIGAECLRSLLKEQPDAHFDAYSQTLILYAARRDLVEKIIKPALAKNVWVLCDRFADSTFVYQGFAQGLPIASIEKIHNLVLGSFTPDLTFFFDIPPEAGIKRTKERTESLDLFTYDNFDFKDLDFHEKIYEGFQILAAGSKRILPINALLPTEQVTDQLLDALNARFQIGLE